MNFNKIYSPQQSHGRYRHKSLHNDALECYDPRMSTDCHVQRHLQSKPKPLKNIFCCLFILLGLLAHQSEAIDKDGLTPTGQKSADRQPSTYSALPDEHSYSDLHNAARKGNPAQLETPPKIGAPDPDTQYGEKPRENSITQSTDEQSALTRAPKN